jgi:methionine sulfoxide reductase heme-binding subunit
MSVSHMNQVFSHPAVKPMVWLLALLPLAWLTYAAVSDGLGANPAEALIRATGDWALRGLCIALAVTPIRQLFGWNALSRLRRLLGLFAFFYVCLHVLVYAWLDMGWQWKSLWDDVLQRPFIGVGALAVLVLLLLALTSPRAVLRAMGGRNWQRLHQGIHLAAWLALLHFSWMRASKNNLQEVWLYVAIIGLLQAWRIWRKVQPSRMRKP